MLELVSRERFGGLSRPDSVMLGDEAWGKCDIRASPLSDNMHLLGVILGCVM